MAMQIKTIENFQQYLNAVRSKADHHAQQVQKIIMPLAGMVMLKANGGITVRSYGEATGNILWFVSDGQRYAFRYDHSKLCIELRQGSFKGEIIAEFTDQTSLAEVNEIFMQL